MARGWQGSTRRQRLPADWAKIRQRILKRDGYQCTWIDGTLRCTARATDVDHVIPNDCDDESNLASLCGPHHRWKSGHEGGTASQRNRPKRLRKPEKHPGLI